MLGLKSVFRRTIFRILPRSSFGASKNAGPMSRIGRLTSRMRDIGGVVTVGWTYDLGKGSERKNMLSI